MHHSGKLKTRSSACAALGSLLLLTGCNGATGTPIHDGDTVAGTNDVINLEQGWSRETQDQAWFLSFGSRLIPYRWFLHLEQADSGEALRADSALERLGFLPQDLTANNPDALPVGMSRDVDEDGLAWVGLTCAACHTGEVHAGERKIRIDGGQSLLDFSAFETAVVDALTATLAQPDKFERFARAVLGTDAGVALAVDELKAAVQQRTDALLVRQRMNATDVAYGHARLDAFGQIFNAAAVEFLGIPDNRRAPDAPVSYPVLWSAPHLDLVQWNGSAPNAGPGPLVQNATTALAVYGHMQLDSNDGKPGYASSVNIDNLAKLQNWVYALKAPRWPEAILGAIDREQAAKGAALYAAECQSCHALAERDDAKRKLKAELVPVSEIGTDPTMANNFLQARANTGRLEGKKVAHLAGEKMGPTTPTINVVVHAAIGALLRHPMAATRAAIVDYHSVHKASVDARPNYYKARPLDGIWSSAPYLHNGSVPTLDDLLLPPDERPATFYVGARQLDTQRVGLTSMEDSAHTLFDTTLPGNSNQGHTYGTQLQGPDRAALLEFLKTL